MEDHGIILLPQENYGFEDGPWCEDFWAPSADEVAASLAAHTASPITPINYLTTMLQFLLSLTVIVGILLYNGWERKTQKWKY